MNKAEKDTKEKKKSRKSIIYFIGCLVFSLGMTWLLREPNFTDSQVYALFLLFFAISLWITEAIPPFAVGLFILAYLTYTFGNPHLNSNPEPIDKYVNTFSSRVIWLLLGGFFLGAAMSKTRLDMKLLRFVLHHSGTNPRNILIVLMFTTMVASMLMSGTATTAMIVVAIMPLLNTLGKSGISKAMLLGVAMASSLGGMGTIIGSPANAMTVGILENEGVRVSFLSWMIYGLPVAIVLTALCCWLLLKIFVKTNDPLSLAFLDNDKDNEEESPFQQRIVIGVLLVTILLWLTSSWHDITVAAVSAIPLVVLTLTRVLTSADMKALPWDTLFLVAGGLSLGAALQSTEILHHYVHQFKDIDINPYVFILIFALVSNIFAGLMSNAASTMILVPLGMTLLAGLEKEVALSIALAASTAIFLPISTTANAIVYSTELLDQKDFRLVGLLIGVLGPVLAVLWVLLVGGKLF
ncbi:SLC13/DASS family transporter [Adhaeribacter sp. BT258]|uniref:SLC13/DASS family transporter n=1 Tax=Adhaeribacter terrigena TaxID=2793070 RepID=A0ABS1C5N9_9BACT|nr:DASS family sodium-coupled anion symporter [Adhaeribacter terrigena]MBK0404686.1 SLC13/DASS family transporter [Adhaeribacter terrigena]